MAELSLPLFRIHRWCSNLMSIGGQQRETVSTSMCRQLYHYDVRGDTQHLSGTSNLVVVVGERVLVVVAVVMVPPVEPLAVCCVFVRVWYVRVCVVVFVYV